MPKIIIWTNFVKKMWFSFQFNSIALNSSKISASFLPYVTNMTFRKGEWLFAGIIKVFWL